ncbi:MAG: hypothetical protein R2838_12910 [Caldilineaceae bacterium]
MLATVNQLDQHPAYHAAITTPLQLAEYLGTVENGRATARCPATKGWGPSAAARIAPPTTVQTRRHQPLRLRPSRFRSRARPRRRTMSSPSA